MNKQWGGRANEMSILLTYQENATSSFYATVLQSRLRLVVVGNVQTYFPYLSLVSVIRCCIELTLELEVFIPV